MKNILILLFLLINLMAYSQDHGQFFCDDFNSDDYFPLTIEKKKIIWSNSYYYEEIIGDTTINKIKYINYLQTWENGEANKMLLREEDGIVFQLEECCNEETIRLNKESKEKDSWMTADESVSYTILSFKGKLETPYCKYENLLIIEAVFPKATFEFYYKKGYGYIGAANNGNMISYVTPKW